MNLLGSLQQYWHTIWHLRWEQVVGQLWMRTRLFRYCLEGPTEYRHEPFPGCCVEKEKSWLPPPSGGNRGAEILLGRFSFVQETHCVNWPPQWDSLEASKLWEYNLFYFDWLWLLSADDAKSVVQDWIHFAKCNPAHTGMDPYPTSLRLVNFCGVFFHKYADAIQKDEGFRELLWQSICEQVECLRGRLEYHLLGNHLFENAVALCVVGSCLEGKVAKAWLKQGVTLLQREVQEQILPDGLHFELSPMYHLRMIYTMMLLRQHGHSSVASVVSERLPVMFDALVKLCHPDQGIALLNDSAFQIYHTPNELLDWRVSWDEQAGASLRKSWAWEGAKGVWSLPSAGYYGASSEDGHYIVCDAGPPGPDYIPGHAHGDIFSFSLSLYGQRIIVDSGVYDYVDSGMRRYCRSTQAHNTVTIDDMDQSEFWGAFRVARRARPRDVYWKPTEEGFVLEGWHDGYNRLSEKRASHKRYFQWSQAGRLEVHDTIQAASTVLVASRLHLHPSCSIVSQTSHHAVVATPVGEVNVRFTGPGTLLSRGTEQSWYCPTFGVREANHVLVFQTTGRLASFSFVVE